MIVSKFNKFTGKYYHYDLDDFDFFTPMFDESLHDDSFNAESIHAELLDYEHKKVCSYCQTEFSSRNDLFKHLGYHGVDIRKPDSDDVNMFSIVKRRKRRNSNLASALKKLCL
jgi:hypothetical protein